MQPTSPQSHRYYLLLLEPFFNRIGYYFEPDDQIADE